MGVVYHALDKERILELYLNEIFLGQNSYGVTAAALNSLDRGICPLRLASSRRLGVADSVFSWASSFSATAQTPMATFRAAYG